MSDTRWCSYRELAEVWGVALPAAKARVRRAGWHRIKGNDGGMRIEAPVAALTASPPTSGATEPTTVAPVLPVDDVVAELRAERDRARGEADTLRQEMGKLRERAARAEGEVGPLREALADLSARLDRAEARLAMPWWRRLIG